MISQELMNRRKLLGSPAIINECAKLELSGACPQTIQNLYLMVKEKPPNLVFFKETKMIQSKLKFLKRRLGYNCCFTMEPVGISGGMILLWSKELNLEI